MDIIGKIPVRGQLSSKLTDGAQGESQCSRQEKPVATQELSAQAAGSSDTPHWLCSSDMGLSAQEALRSLIARHEPLVRKLWCLLTEKAGNNDPTLSASRSSIGGINVSRWSQVKETFSPDHFGDLSSKQQVQ